MRRKIVFIGNCQMEVLQNLFDKFVGGVTGDQSFFLPAWTQLDDRGTATLASADLLVDQVQSFTRGIDLPPSIAATPRVLVPLVSASFLWPFAGSAHPMNADNPWRKGGAYPGELGDGFLNRLIKESVPAQQAVEQYRAYDLGGRAALDRRFEIIIDQQRLRDEECDFQIVQEIETHFRTEHLFFSPHHPGLRVTRSLAAQCFSHIGAPRSCVEMLERDLTRAPFPQDELPIHPHVAQHFDLSYIRPDTTFSQGEGRFTWDEWVIRYVNYTWSPALFQGWAIASAEPELARALLTPVIAQMPHSPLVHAAMAKALYAQQQPSAASYHITEALRLAPTEPEFARTAAFISAALGQRDAAIRFARDAVIFDAGNVANLQLLARIQEDAGEIAQAEGTRRTIVQLQPNQAAGWTDLGTILANLDRLDQSIASYEHAIEIAPEDASAYFGRSLILARLNRSEEAIQAVERAISLRPGVAAYFSHIGHLLLRIGRREQGIVAFRTALQTDPDNAGIHNLLADMMLQDQRSTEAIHHAIRAADSAPTTPQYHARVAHLMTRHLRLVEAIEAYQRALMLLPDDRMLHTELGNVFVRLDRLEEAAAELKQGISPNGPEPKLVSDLTSVLISMARFSEAGALVGQAAATWPDDTHLRQLQVEIEHVTNGQRLAAVGSKFLARRVDEIVPDLEITAPACIQYTNFQEVNPSFGAHHVEKLYVGKRRWVPAVCLCQLPPDARLAVPNGEEFIGIVGTQVVAEQIRRDWPIDRLDDEMAECTTHAVIDQPAVLIGRYGVRTWGHWLGELLPKVIAVESRWPGRFKYIVPDRFDYDLVHATAVESLAYYGIGKERLVLAVPRTMYTCSSLHVVSSAWSAERVLHPEIAAMMRSFGPRMPEPAPGWLKVALLRRSTRTRNIQNLAAVQDVLVENGFTLVDIETLNFCQQVDLFKNADTVVSVLGSGLSGLMYAPRGVKVLTMAPGEWGDLFFYSMIQERDASYVDIRGQSLATDRDGVGTSGFMVPIEALRAGLMTMGISRRV